MSNSTVAATSRVQFMLLTTVLMFTMALSLALPAYAQENATEKGRVVILGFDGVEPSIVESLMQKGELKNLAQLRERGNYQHLHSSNPPQSPTAWSSFATCKNPGNHGIYDFLRRSNVQRYIPGVGFGITKHPELAPDGALEEPAQYQNYRKGETFWSVADKQQARCKVLVVPFAYPVEDLSDGCMLCGLDTPDIRGTQRTYFYLGEDQKGEDRVAGGIRMPLRFSGNETTVRIPGARDPRKRSSDPGAYVEVPVTFGVDRESRTLVITLQDQQLTLAEGTWSEWVEWTFPVSSGLTVRAISRFHVLEAGDQVRLYMGCLQFHPRDPYIPISSPAQYASELADRYGLYKTIGWAYDTKALQQDVLTEDLFLEDVRKTMAWREMLMIDELKRGNFDLLISAWTATDRVAHLFWRFRDPKHPMYTEEGAAKYGEVLEDTYRKMDDIVGKAMAELKPEDLLLVMSDHGFHSFRTAFSANTWLIRNGYLAVKGQDDPVTAYTDTRYLMGFDWSRTKVYGLGLGSLFINQEGREGQGTVAPDDVPGLLAELKEKLLAVTDPDTGDKVFSAIYTRDDYRGESTDTAPDFQLGYAEGYQTDKASAAGAAPKDVFSPNLDKWSGEHASSDVAITSGILFANRPLQDKAALPDLGVTALNYLGLAVPDDFEGKTLLP